MRSIREIRKLIGNTDRIKLEKTEIELIREQISNLMKDYQETTVKYKAGTLLYRGRAFREVSKKPSRIADIAMPPIETCTNFQRANRPGDPKFYCSLTPNALPFELKMDRGQFIAVGTWQVKTDMLTMPIGYSQNTFDKLESWRSLPAWLEPESDPAQRILKNFCCEKFTAQIPDDKSHMYKISTAIAEVLLSRQHLYASADIPVSAIQYPSVPMYADDDNLAIHPKFVEKNMHLVHVEFWEVLGLAFERDFGMQMLDYADSFGADGEIEWKGHVDYDHYNVGQALTDKEAALKMGLDWNEEDGTASKDGMIVGIMPLKPRIHTFTNFC